MANDTLRVDGKDVTLEQIAIDHSDPFYGDDLTITALVAEVRRLRAVEEKYTAAQAQARAICAAAPENGGNHA